MLIAVSPTLPPPPLPLPLPLPPPLLLLQRKMTYSPTLAMVLALMKISDDERALLFEKVEKLSRVGRGGKYTYKGQNGSLG